RCGLIDIVTCGRSAWCCRCTDGDMSVVTTNVNGSIESIDIERASLRQRSNQGCWSVSESAVCRLLRKSKTFRKIAIFQINGVIVKETHPLPVIDGHSCKSVTERIELKRLTQIERASDCHICNCQTRV